MERDLLGIASENDVSLVAHDAAKGNDRLGLSGLAGLVDEDVGEVCSGNAESEEKAGVSAAEEMFNKNSQGEEKRRTSR